MPKLASFLAVVFASLCLISSIKAAPQNIDATAPASSAPRIIELRISDEIEPILAEYVVGGIDEAAREHASLVLITIDTPGGLETSMQQIIQRILSSPVPVVVYVWPTASRAASAG